MSKNENFFLYLYSIILLDNDNGTETNLKSGPYIFSATAGETNSRFLIKYQKTLGTKIATFDENSVVVYKTNEKISIKSNSASIENVKLFDLGGRLLFEKAKVNTNETTIESLKYGRQVLVVKITSDDNTVVSKKIVN